MSAVTLQSGVASTTNNAAVVSASFTPTVGDLLVVVAMHSGLTTNPAVTASANGITFTAVAGPILKNTSADVMAAFIANQFVPSTPAAMTCTTTPGSSSGGLIFVFSVTLIARTAAQALRQAGSQANGAAAATPAPAFGVAALSGNPILGAIFNTTNPAGMTPPTGWTETATIGDIGHTVPAAGGEAAFLAAGNTATTQTWGSTSATAFCSLVLEIDTSAAPRSFPFPRNLTKGLVLRQRSRRSA